MIPWKSLVGGGVAIIFGLVGYVYSGDQATQAKQNDLFQQEIQAILDTEKQTSINVAIISQQLKDINLPLLNSSIQNTEVRIGRIETQLKLK